MTYFSLNLTLHYYVFGGSSQLFNKETDKILFKDSSFKLFLGKNDVMLIIYSKMVNILKEKKHTSSE